MKYLTDESNNINFISIFIKKILKILLKIFSIYSSLKIKFNQKLSSVRNFKLNKNQQFV